MRLLIVLLIAFSTEAGIVYRENWNGRGSSVWIDGDKRRIEIDPQPDNPTRTYDVSITANGKTTLINLRNKTYYYEGEDRPPAGFVTTNRLYQLPFGFASIEGKPKITYRNDGAGPAIGDHATTWHVIQFRYRAHATMHGTSLYGDVAATVTMLTANMLARFKDPPLIITGFPDLDSELKKHFESIDGLVVGYEVSVGRKLEDGPIITEDSRMSVEELKTIDVDPKLFEIPKGLTHQPPVYGIPGS